eukprot:6194331-Pleurochrysis_carterae.AAC.1
MRVAFCPRRGLGACLGASRKVARAPAVAFLALAFSLLVCRCEERVPVLVEFNFLSQFARLVVLEQVANRVQSEGQVAVGRKHNELGVEQCAHALAESSHAADKFVCRQAVG